MNASDDDLIHDLLKPPRSVHVSHGLRAELRSRTARRVLVCRQHIQMRRWGMLAACYLVGILTATIWPGISVPEAADDTHARPAKLHAARPDEIDAVPSEEPEVALESWPAYRIELQAMSGESGERATLLRLAGDQYLKESDIGAATRCYAQVARWDIEHGNPANVDDSWLLTALKQSIQRKETHDAWVE